MSLQTYNRMNITFEEVLVRPILITCVIALNEERAAICHVSRYYSELDNAQVIVRFSNNADFRTIIQLDMVTIMDKIMSYLDEESSIGNIQISDRVTAWHDDDHDAFINPWRICHQTVMINERFFNATELQIVMTMNN
jgi:hypothetical protein